MKFIIIVDISLISLVCLSLAIIFLFVIHSFIQSTDPIGTCSENLAKCPAPVLYVNYRNFDGPVMYPDHAEDEGVDEILSSLSASATAMNSQTSQQLEKILKKDPLDPLTSEDKCLLWQLRANLIRYPTALPKFLQSVVWDDCQQVIEAHRLLRVWTKPSPTQAIELLDARYADPTVREYAVKILGNMPDGDLEDILLQFTQVHNSLIFLHTKVGQGQT
tara:strand:- start:2465 stop:3121 length:657 start_codon:yes stop_codon:yes gene_type:complete